MSDEMGSADDVIHIRVMNEHGGGLPLWPDDVDTDVDDLALSEELRADLMTFVDRWDAAIDPEVTDDRWDGVPRDADPRECEVLAGQAPAPGARTSGGR